MVSILLQKSMLSTHLSQIVFIYLYLVDIGSPVWLFFLLPIPSIINFIMVPSLASFKQSSWCLVYIEGILYHCKKGTLGFFPLLAHLCEIAGLRSTFSIVNITPIHNTYFPAACRLPILCKLYSDSSLLNCLFDILRLQWALFPEEGFAFLTSSLSCIEYEVFQNKLPFSHSSYYCFVSQFSSVFQFSCRASLPSYELQYRLVQRLYRWMFCRLWALLIFGTTNSSLRLLKRSCCHVQYYNVKNCWYSHPFFRNISSFRPFLLKLHILLGENII